MGVCAYHRNGRIDLSSNGCENSLQLAIHIACRKTQNAVSGGTQKRIAFGIMCSGRICGVLLAVNFNNYFATLGAEISNVIADWNLTTKMRSLQRDGFAQSAP